MVVSLTLVNPGIRISRVCHLIVVKSRSTAIKSFLFKSKCQHGGGLIKNLAVVRGGAATMANKISFILWLTQCHDWG